MGTLTHILAQTLTVLVTTRNKYGDQEYTSGVSELCRFREITAIDLVSNRSNNREEIKADAMLWVEPESTIEEGKIIRVEGNFYRVGQVTRARKMDGEVRFVKCVLEKYFDIEGVS